jgi:carbamate kinase
MGGRLMMVPLFDFPEAERLARAHGWAIAPDRGGVGWRHVVPSPEPQAVAELGTFRILIDGGVSVLWPVHADFPWCARRWARCARSRRR